MIAEIGAGLESIKAATELLKLLNATMTQGKVDEIKIGLQKALLDAHQSLFSAQEAHTACAARVHKLESQIAEAEDWASEKQRYELSPVGDGAFAYVLKVPMNGNQRGPWYCPNCFEKRMKSIYQKQAGNIARAHLVIPTIYECSACSSKIAP